jgi:hypothetical protein
LAGAVITPAPQTGRRVFTTSVPFVLKDGLTPNTVCLDDAKAANLPNPDKFVAFVAYPNASAMSNVSLDGPPWKRMDGVFIVNQPSDLGNSRPLAPIDVAANGTYTTAAVWSGAAEPRAQGTDATTCGNWTPSTLRTYGLAGDSQTSAAPDWFNAANPACISTTTHLMCIEP